MGFIEECLGESEGSEIGTGTVPPRWAGTAQPLSLSLEEIERQIKEIGAYEMF
jgi:hypothetical protein